MSPQRRAALTSVFAAAALVALKLSVGLASHSLGLLSEALHSGTDLVAALLTYFAVRVAARPADVTHQYGHGKAEHLAALAEASILVLASLFISARAIDRLVRGGGADVDAAWWALAAIVIVIAIDVSRVWVSWRVARRYSSAAIASNALHFGGDLGGSLAVLVGLLFVRAGHPDGVSLAAAVGQGHAAADAVEEAVEQALPGSDVVVHVEPLDDASLRERAHAAALTVRGVREIHNLALVDVDGRIELSLHLKLPGELPLDAAHDLAEDVERAIRAAVPEIDVVQSHLEPLTEAAAGSEEAVDAQAVEQIVRAATGRPPRDIRFMRTEAGLVAFLTLGLDPQSRLDDAHARASEIEERIRAERPEIADVIVHTEP